MRCPICKVTIPYGDDVILDGVSVCPCCGAPLDFNNPTYGPMFVKDFAEAIRVGKLTLDDDEE